MDSGFEAQRQIGIWMNYYNEKRPHSYFDDDSTPMEVYNRRLAA